jgi:hypothetical protein
MRYHLGLIVLIVCMILASGCTTTQKMKNPILPSTTVPPTPIPISPPSYHIGDIAKEHPEDNVGMVILDYSPSGGVYRARPVYLDDYGKVFFVDYKGEGSYGTLAFQTTYPVMAGHIENPYRIVVDTSRPRPKYDRGTVIGINDYDRLQGIVILDYYPQSDSYRIRYIKYVDGIWKYDGSSDAIAARSDIERNYPYSIGRVDPNTISQG